MMVLSRSWHRWSRCYGCSKRSGIGRVSWYGPGGECDSDNRGTHDFVNSVPPHHRSLDTQNLFSTDMTAARKGNSCATQYGPDRPRRQSKGGVARYRQLRSEITATFSAFQLLSAKRRQQLKTDGNILCEDERGQDKGSKRFTVAVCSCC